MAGAVVDGSPMGLGLNPVNFPRVMMMRFIVLGDDDAGRDVVAELLVDRAAEGG